ncbi:unnamed protein product [Protopolystoma xenopodis]|uniref:Uncharacterized protein n=1 Tax=Protopolystoma xenopodis TaxID=117903 RepID=A0A3S5ACT4_9PLAT|nr:unnamed protein product [Protopolystoma xenopodis]
MSNYLNATSNTNQLCRPNDGPVNSIGTVLEESSEVHIGSLGLGNALALAYDIHNELTPSCIYSSPGSSSGAAFIAFPTVSPGYSFSQQNTNNFSTHNLAFKSLNNEQNPLALHSPAQTSVFQPIELAEKVVVPVNITVQPSYSSKRPQYQQQHRVVVQQQAVVKPENPSNSLDFDSYSDCNSLNPKQPDQTIPDYIPFLHPTVSQSLATNLSQSGLLQANSHPIPSTLLPHPNLISTVSSQAVVNSPPVSTFAPVSSPTSLQTSLSSSVSFVSVKASITGAPISNNSTECDANNNPAIPVNDSIEISNKGSSEGDNLNIVDEGSPADATISSPSSESNKQTEHHLHNPVLFSPESTSASASLNSALADASISSGIHQTINKEKSSSSDDGMYELSDEEMREIDHLVGLTLFLILFNLIFILFHCSYK